MNRHRDNGPEVSLRRRLLSLRTVLAFVVAGSLLAFLVVRLDIDLAEVGHNLGRSNPLLYGTALVLYYLSFLVRGLRWRIILGNVEARSGSGQRLPGALACAQFILLGWFANTVTWFRLGEVYRPYLVTESTGASFSRTAGTVLAERVMDLLLVFGLLAASVLFAAATGEISAYALFPGIAFGLALVAGLVLLLMRQFGMRVAGLLPQSLAQAYYRFHQGAFLAFHRLPLVVGLGVVGWLCEVARLYFVVQALGYSLPLSMVVFVSMAHAVLTTIPITPGGLGIAGPGMVGLLMLRMSQQQAVSIALLDRTITYLSIVVFGGLLFLVREVRKQRRGSLVSMEPRGR